MFQDRYRSEAVAEDSYALALVRYIHKNPLKACMVNHIMAYQWSSYQGYFVENHFTSKILDTEVILGMFSENKKKARDLFLTYMGQEARDSFLDIDGANEMMDDDEALRLFGSMLSKRGIKPGEGTKVEIPGDLLIEYKNATNFSIRKLALIVGVNKDKLCRVLREHRQ